MRIEVVEEIKPDLFRIKVPLPNNPLKELNSYVIRSRERNLIIDTGFNRPQCLEVMEEGVFNLGLDLTRTDFFLTHLHADHTGLVVRLASKTSAVYFSRVDAQMFKREEPWKAMIDYAKINGFPEEELLRAISNHPGFKYSPQSIPEFDLVDDGREIEVGRYRLKCLWTPGHTPGHMCLYDEKEKLLFSGDHVLFDITPHIESWSYQVNALHDYLSSLDRIRDLPVAMVLPGHRSFFTDLKGRIDALKKHHYLRAEEVLEVLNGKRKTAYEIASQMTWDIDYERWEDFPIAQKWFATGEAIAHLRFLEEEGKVERNIESGLFWFSRK
ncbi:MAG: MBL fold metallo-hydrolase [Syntrophales bacterium]|nr:MBL fold metallo-hydrolase [Syntrophales bacterium]